jgi:hypothetical protein
MLSSPRDGVCDASRAVHPCDVTSGLRDDPDTLFHAEAVVGVATFSAWVAVQADSMRAAMLSQATAWERTTRRRCINTPREAISG